MDNQVITQVLVKLLIEKTDRRLNVSSVDSLGIMPTNALGKTPHNTSVTMPESMQQQVHKALLDRRKLATCAELSGDILKAALANASNGNGSELVRKGLEASRNHFEEAIHVRRRRH